MFKKCSLLILILFIFISFCSAQQNKKAELQKLISYYHSLKLFNGNVLVVEKGAVNYTASFGTADTSNKKLSTAYRFNLGSIAKEFNAVAIMMLKEQGKLKLEDKISNYLPDLPAWAQKISILNLLQYTSGVPNLKWNEIKGDADALSKLKLIEKLDFEPGTAYAYNNSNTFLQREIVSRVSGMTFTDFVSQKMSKPLGMKAALIDPSGKEILLALDFNNQKVQDKLIAPFSGWTNLNLNDFLTWSEAINQFRLISPESTKQLTIPFSPGNQTGLGSGIMEGEKLIKHVHDGTSRNFQALLISEPLKKRTIILLTNNKQNNLYAISESIQLLLDGKTYPELEKMETVKGNR